MKFLRLFLLAGCFLSSAVFSKEINYVWLNNPGGSGETICRGIWNNYDTKYNSISIFIPRAGNNGIEGIRDMLNSPNKRKFTCSGPGPLVVNPLIYGDTESLVDQVDPLIQYAESTWIWYVPLNNNSKSFKELIGYFNQLNRPVNIAYLSATQQSIGNYLHDVYGIQVNLIPFKNAQQIYPLVVDGTVDLFFDVGGSVGLAESGKFNVFGYVSKENLKRLDNYNNFKNDDINLIRLSTIGYYILVPKTTDLTIKEEITTRFKEILSQQETKQLLINNLATSKLRFNTAVQQDLEHQRNYIKKILIK